MKKKIVFRIMLTLLLMGMLTWAFNIRPVKASGAIYIRADGSVEGTTDISTVDNVTYTFTNNISDSIVVERDNIVVDGAGYTLQGMGAYGIGINLTRRSNITIKNMEIIAFYRGIYLWASSNNTISGNKITVNDRCGIYVYFSSNNTISGNNVTANNEYGIYIRNSFHNTVSGNNIIGHFPEKGILLEDSSNNTVSGNNMTNNNYGLYHYNGSYNIISGNNMINNSKGIHTDWGTSYNTISGNNITNNLAGIELRGSSSNIISGNNMSGNINYGIEFERSSNNIIYHNNFVNNTNQVYDVSRHAPSIPPSISVWDDGYPSGGNYWSDYNGVDSYSGSLQNESCRDGVGDTVYTIDENNRDRYPLMKPWSTHLNPPVVRFKYDPLLPSIGEKITFNASFCYDLDEDIVSYRWNFDDGNITSTVNPIIVHTYELPGRFNVTLTVIDSKALNCSYSQTVWVRMPTFVSISTSCMSTFVGFTVNVAGTLSDIHGNGLKNETIFLYYTFGGTGTWSPITSDTTDNLGHYFAAWIPPTIGNFEVKAEWAGNSTHFGTFNVTSPNMRAQISISLSSSTSYVGFKIKISGNFTCNEIGYPEAPILLSYSVTGGESWNDITLVNTSSDGSYFAIWMPPATGNYLVKAAWTGNPAYPGATTTVNFAVIPFEEQNVFSVTSNSTISDLAFESTHRELNFNVSGPSGTTGYVDVYIAKTLIENVEDVEVKLNGEEINYTATSLDDSWLLHFTYIHSTHKVTITLGHISAPFIETPLGNVVIYIVPIAAIAILILLYVLKKKRRSR